MKLTRLADPTGSPAPRSPQPTFDAKSCDFIEYLGGRLGVSAEAAEEVLGRWVQSYEPLRRR